MFFIVCVHKSKATVHNDFITQLITLLIRQKLKSISISSAQRRLCCARQASAVCRRGEWELKADLRLSPSRRPQEETAKMGRGDARINKRSWLFEDVRRQHLSCAPTEPRTCADNTSADQRNLYSTRWGSWGTGSWEGVTVTVGF